MSSKNALAEKLLPQQQPRLLGYNKTAFSLAESMIMPLLQTAHEIRVIAILGAGAWEHYMLVIVRSSRNTHRRI